MEKCKIPSQNYYHYYHDAYNGKEIMNTRELRILTWLCSGTTERARSSSRLYSLEVGNRMVRLSFITKHHAPANKTIVQVKWLKNNVKQQLHIQSEMKLVKVLYI